MSRFLELIGWQRSAESLTGVRRALVLAAVAVVVVGLVVLMNKVVF